jgi:hypothetical protein
MKLEHIFWNWQRPQALLLVPGLLARGLVQVRREEWE